MPPTPSAAIKKQPITLAQMSSYDDILTDALVDHSFYWTTIPKNRPSYHPSRGLKEEDITKIIQTHLVVTPDLQVAESKLLATDGLRRFYDALKTPKEKDDFRAHLRRYIQIYLPDCPFEVSSTNRYTIVTHEAAVTARKFIKKGQPVKYLTGTQVLITEKEEKELSSRKKDFSIVVSARNKCASLFMGPARFANHDCDANARLMITGQAGIEIIAAKNIEVGDEITVTYSENYFGEDNCECLCKSCEDNVVNGWAQADGAVAVKKSIEEAAAEGYLLRRRRRDESCASTSRTPSVAPDIRPRVPKSRSKTLKVNSERASATRSPSPQSLLRRKRKRELESLKSPPITPAKRLKTLQYEVEAIPVPQGLSTDSSDADSTSAQSPSESGSTDIVLTEATTPEEDIREPVLSSPRLTPVKSQVSALKREDSDISSLSDVVYPTPVPDAQDSISVAPLPTIEHVAQADQVATPTSAVVEAGELSPVALIAPPPPASPATPISTTAQILPATAVAAEPTTATSEPTPTRGRARGRPRKGTGPAPVVRQAPEDATPPPTRTRTPGDYTLTPVLLSEPNTAWIHCMVCSEPFVQQNAYYTRSSCPRCERHSKLYGFQWPKTEREGPGDREERILDHRVVHRFLTAEDEAKIRGRKVPGEGGGKRSVSVSAGQGRSGSVGVGKVGSVGGSGGAGVSSAAPQTPEKRGRGRPRKYPRPEELADKSPESPERDINGFRRSGRRRNPSSKIITY
ncbi:hypothetical protein F5B20DRAFT_5721 [Whalleya microplaca]|nr:hypothetical protein F5B20DRAFT_5721 [Whalleya microplaca]